MGGMNSGTWYRWNTKGTTDESRELDIRVLHRGNSLTSGYRGSYSWSCGGEPGSSIQYRVEQGKIVLSYRYHANGGEWEDIEEPVSLTYTPCNYGGQRPWFICPAVGCNRRVAVIYGAGRYFACRHCYDLVYQSQRECILGRASRRSRKIITRLGGDPSIPYAKKPKGMRWNTYNGLMEKVNQDEDLLWDAINTYFKPRH
jgi:hypothetical protein